MIATSKDLRSDNHEETVHHHSNHYRDIDPCDLLMYLIENHDQVLSRDQILDRVWGLEYDGYDRAVDTHIKKLRAALGPCGAHVETVIKAGYMWKTNSGS